MHSSDANLWLKRSLLFQKQIYTLQINIQNRKGSRFRYLQNINNLQRVYFKSIQLKLISILPRFIDMKRV